MAFGAAPRIARCEQKVCLKTWQPMWRSPARLRAYRSAASMIPCELPSTCQKIRSLRRCRCARSAAASRGDMGMGRCRLLGRAHEASPFRCRTVILPAAKSTSPHSRAMISPWRNPASAPRRKRARRSRLSLTARKESQARPSRRDPDWTLPPGGHPRSTGNTAQADERAALSHMQEPGSKRMQVPAMHSEK
jgi:hypothetical protein